MAGDGGRSSDDVALVVILVVMVAVGVYLVGTTPRLATATRCFSFDVDKTGTKVFIFSSSSACCLARWAISASNRFARFCCHLMSL